MSARWHPSDRQRSNRDGVFGRPRQRQTRREAGTQSYGLLTVRGGTDKAARLPKGWTGPVSKLGLPGFREEARIVFCASFSDRCSRFTFGFVPHWPFRTRSTLLPASQLLTNRLRLKCTAARLESLHRMAGKLRPDLS